MRTRCAEVVAEELVVLARVPRLAVVAFVGVPSVRLGGAVDHLATWWRNVSLTGTRECVIEDGTRSTWTR